MNEDLIKAALSWYRHYDIPVREVDFPGTGVALYYNNMNLELSKDEVEYRAELWFELEEIEE